MCGLLHALLLWSLLQRYRTLCLARNMTISGWSLFGFVGYLKTYVLHIVFCFTHTTNIEEKYVYLCTLLRFVFETIMPSLFRILLWIKFTCAPMNILYPYYLNVRIIRETYKTISKNIFTFSLTGTFPRLIYFCLVFKL